jgi:hypothetical protein
MYFKTYWLAALVFVLAIGMGCGGGSSSSTTTGGDASSTMIGTWNLTNVNPLYPKQIVFNTNGGKFIFSTSTTDFSWSQPGNGNVVTITSGAAVYTITLDPSTPNTFTLVGLSGSGAGVYTRA